MLIFPKFLNHLSDTAARKTQSGDPVKIELLGCQRAKPPLGWKVSFSLGDVIVALNLPSDAFGHADAMFLLESLASAIRKDPPDQLALVGMTRADPRFVEGAAPKQTGLGLPDPNEGRRPPPPLTPPPAVGAAGGELKPPRGRKPKPGWCRFRVVGSDPKTEVLIDALGLLAKWEQGGEPNDTYTGEEFLGPWSPGEAKSTAECTRPAYAGTLNTTNHALWLCDGDQYLPGKGQWVHVEALGRNPDSLGQEPLGSPKAPPPEFGKARERVLPTPGCCVCGWPMIPNWEDPQPVKCEECDLAGRGPKVAMHEIGLRSLNEDGSRPDTEPPPEGAEEPPATDPPPPFDELGTAACRSCAFFVEELDGDPAECLHHAHAPNRFSRPCSDRRPSRGK